jgi:hypothetical protein
MVAFLPVMGVGQVASAKVHPVVVFNICDRYAARRDRPHPPARASPALPPDGDAPTALERATRSSLRALRASLPASRQPPRASLTNSVDVFPTTNPFLEPCAASSAARRRSRA